MRQTSGVVSSGLLAAVLALLAAFPHAEGAYAELSVAVVGPAEYRESLRAYSLHLECYQPQGTEYEVSLHLVQPPYDSSSVHSLITDSLASCDYIVLFGTCCGCNDAPATTLPCPYLKDPGDPVGNGCRFSLWNWERGLEDSSRVERCIGYVPAESEDDVWNYLEKMVDCGWNRKPTEYRSRLGSWGYDLDYGGNSGEYVHSILCSAIDNAHPGWMVDSLWASRVSPGARADSALSALKQGRNLVMIVGTLGRLYDLCRWLSSFDGVAYYADVRPELARTGAYCHLLAMSAETHEISRCDLRETSIVAELMRVPLGGAMTSIGESGGFYQVFNEAYLEKFMEVYNREGGDLTMGEIHKRVRNELLADSADTSLERLMPLFCKTTFLLGDPTVRVGGPSSTAEAGLGDSYSIAAFDLVTPTPNPFVSETSFAFSLPRAGPVTFHVYDVRGRLVRSLMEDWTRGGPHTLVWDGCDQNGRRLASGVYFCRLASGSEAASQKVLFLR